MASGHVISADVSVTSAGLIIGVHDDNRNTGGMCLRDNLCQAARIRRTGDDPSSMRGDGSANGFLLRRNIAAMEGGANLGAGVLGPPLRTLQEKRPDRIGW